MTPAAAGPVVWDVVVVGSGPGGAVIASRLQAAGKRVLVLEEGERPALQTLRRSTDSLLCRFYRNSGAVPFFGPFTFAFGEGKVAGGGSFVNAGLIWPAPERVLKDWAEKLPGSVFDSSRWRAAEARVRADLQVNTDHNFTGGANAASKIMHEAALALNWRSVPVPRAVVNCQNSNRCATGCPSGARRSMVEACLVPFEQGGGTLLTDTRVVKIVPPKVGKAGEIVFRNSEGTGRAKFSKAVISAGATQSALLLRKSGLSRTAGRQFEFHLNFKVLARFPFTVDAARGTLLTHQVQEFEDEGILIMATGFNGKYLALELGKLDGKAAAGLRDGARQLGLYSVMIRPRAAAKLYDLFGQTFGRWSWDAASDKLMRRGLLKTCELLFKAGALEVVLPLRRTRPLVSLREAAELLAASPTSDFSAVSVHGMSANRMGTSPDNSVVDLDARVWGQKDIFVADSSILPTNLGESPQGTIMTAAHELADRWLAAGLV
ncbi:MAG TPA: hypothetical protein DCZ92_10965 [Elusimicrobia bacterium]|nr:hypothetical protein [Elusimicrobiota bacterium]